jgi:glucosamine--fructose-6-phosphate aminotransferase (isomerizing)
VPILAIRPDGRMGALVDEGIAAALATGSVPWLIGGPDVPRALVAGQDPARVNALPLPPGLPAALASLATVLPGQLLAEAVSRRRGYDPDAPPGLRKVTLTR